MEENNIITTEEEGTMMTERNDFGLGAVVGTVITVAGILAYKKIIKPIAKKCKSKKETEVPLKKEIVIDEEDVSEVDE